MRILVVWLINTLYTEHFIQVLEKTLPRTERGREEHKREQGTRVIYLPTFPTAPAQEISGPDMATS